MKTRKKIFVLTGACFLFLLIILTITLGHIKNIVVPFNDFTVRTKKSLIAEYEIVNSLMKTSGSAQDFYFSPSKHSLATLKENMGKHRNAIAGYESYLEKILSEPDYYEKRFLEELHLLSENYLKSLERFTRVHTLPPDQKEKELQHILKTQKNLVSLIAARYPLITQKRIYKINDLINKKLIKCQHNILILILSIILIVLVVFYILRSHITGHREILIGIEEFRKGNLGYRIKKVANNELDVLIKSLHNMVRKRAEVENKLRESLLREERLREELKIRLNQNALLNEIIYSTMVKWDLKSIFKLVLQSLENSGILEYGLFSLYKNGKVELTCYSTGALTLASDIGFKEGKTIDIEKLPLLKRWIEEKFSIEEDVYYDEFDHSVLPPKIKRLIEKDVKRILMIPLRVGDELFGFLFAARESEKVFNKYEKDFLHRVCEYISLNILHLYTYQDLLVAYEDLKEASSALDQQNRIIAIGQMASGIVHDINNSLSPIIGFSDLLLENKSVNESVKKYIRYIKDSAENIEQTTKRLRDFYRKRSKREIVKNVNVNGIIDQVINLLEPFWKDQSHERGIKYEIKRKFAGNLDTIQTDEAGFKDSLANIILNSLEAMPHGGVLEIRTGMEDDLIFVEVVDRGIGMDEETLKRCIEPFYSTKGESGTGLGLSQVYGFVKRYNGDFKIKSKPGEGTTIRVSLPISQPVEGVEKLKKIKQPGPYREGYEKLTVLVIDDDPMLRLLLKEMIAFMGHIAIIAGGGKQGIDLFRNYTSAGRRIDIVFTDLGMPDINGKKVAMEVKKINPGIPVVLLTGWGERFEVENNIPQEVDEVLSKPPRIDKLYSTIERLVKKASM